MEIKAPAPEAIAVPVVASAPLLPSVSPDKQAVPSSPVVKEPAASLSATQTAPPSTHMNVNSQSLTSLSKAKQKRFDALVNRLEVAEGQATATSAVGGLSIDQQERYDDLKNRLEAAERLCVTEVAGSSLSGRQQERHLALLSRLEAIERKVPLRK